MRRLSPAFLAALAACATMGEPAEAPPPPSFREVRSLVLVRMAEDRAGRAKDPLDGLAESLRARGFTVRVVDLVASRRAEQKALERLFVDLETRAGATRGERFGTRPYSTMGREAADTVAALGVDAVVSYHSLGWRRSMPFNDEPTLPGTFVPGPPVTPERGPVGALALVDRAGHLATFAWGETTMLDDPDVPLNAAEAIDLVVRTLTSEAGAE
jgi:hypothetical protein